MDGAPHTMLDLCPCCMLSDQLLLDIQADADGSGAIDFEEFYGLWFSLTRPNEVTLQEVKTILQRRCRRRAGLIVRRCMHACVE